METSPEDKVELKEGDDMNEATATDKYAPAQITAACTRPKRIINPTRRLLD